MAPALNGDAADLLVVGAGAAGMTAALVAALEGRRVILAEATQQVGGTTSTSAGTLWVPGNPHAARAGHGDTVQQAATYLRALLGPDDARGRRQAFLDTTAEALAYLEERSSVVFASAGKHPDYLPQPGAAIAGRAVGPLPFDGRTLGADFARIRPPLPGFMLLGGMMVGKADIQALVGRYGSWKDFLHSARLVARYAADRLRHPRGTRLVMGNALVARLFQSLLAAKVDVRFGWRLRDLEVHEGRVVGASFDQADGAVRHVAAPAVVLATGGVGHQAALRRELVPDGDSFRSLAAESVRGDGMLAARRAGAAIERHALGNLLWQPVSVVPGTSTAGGLFPHLFLDRAKPGLIAVNVAGRRFVDESLSYHHFVEGLLPQGRAWLVCDAAFVRRYGLGVIPPGTRRLGRWVRNGYIACEPTLAALGPEPLDPTTTGDELWRALRRSRSRVKTQLLSQRPIAGVGNIYADEALWRARVHPARRTVTRADATRLLTAIREVLAAGIEHGGTTLRDYRSVDGEEGDNQHHLDCYGRAGQPCPRCGTALVSRVYDGRTTTFCPSCQRNR